MTSEPFLLLGAVIGKRRRRVTESVQNTSVSSGQPCSSSVDSKPTAVGQDSFLTCCWPASFPDSAMRGLSPRALFPSSLLLPAHSSPGGLATSFTPQCGSRCPPLLGPPDVSRQAIEECLSGQNPRWPPGQGKEWEA